MSERLCVIGLDCLTPQLAFGRWLDEMPHLAKLVGDGLAGRMVSTIPPITVPAWMSMMTSQDPGTLGIYGFRNRRSHAYDDLFIVNGSYVKARPVWNHLSRAGKNSIVLGVPLTYPPQPLRGVLASSFLTPGKDVTWTYPAWLGRKLDEWAGGDYVIDVNDFRTEKKREILDRIREMTRGRFAAFRALLADQPWDFAMMVEMGPDRIHHAFWRYTDPSHRLYEPGNEFEDVIHRYYVELDAEIGRVLDGLPDGTSVIVVSDHGAKTMHGAICINEWLMQEGLLALHRPPDRPQRLSADMVDWSRTRAWGDGGYYARIFLNVAGREPDGQIAPAELEAFTQDLTQKLEGIPDDKGEPIGTRVFKPADIYRACNGIPPDLVVYLGDLDWRSASTVGTGGIHLFENDTGPDDANHAQEGVFVWQGGGRRNEGHDARISIYDIAPSILDHFGLPIPDDMQGKVIESR